MTIEAKISEILAESKKKDGKEMDTDVKDPVADVEASKAVNDNSDSTDIDDENEIGDDNDGDVDANDKNAVVKQELDKEIDPLKGIKEDVAALVEGEDLTEAFKEKAAVIFEAAVMNRVNKEVERLEESYEVKLVEQVEQIKEGLVEKVDGYLDYVVEQWIKQNEIALENGLKSEILEGFVSGLKSLFEEHYIDIPEEKYDVIGNYEEQIQSLNTSLNEQLSANVSLNGELASYQVSQIIGDLAEGLADTDKEKFKSLVEELEFTGVESFQKKAQTIRESYFTHKLDTTVVSSVITDTPIVEEEAAYVAPHMKGYVSALDNLK